MKTIFSLVTSTSGRTKDRVNQDAFSSFPDVVICGFYTFTPSVLPEPVNTNLTLATTPVNLIRRRCVPTVLIWDTMQIRATKEETSAWQPLHLLRIVEDYYHWHRFNGYFIYKLQFCVLSLCFATCLRYQEFFNKTKLTWYCTVLTSQNS